MRSRTLVPSLFVRYGSWSLLALLVFVHCGFVYAGFQGFRTSAVGGVSINVEGVVVRPASTVKRNYLEELRKAIKAPAGELTTPVEMRMISLRELEIACQDAVKNSLGKDAGRGSVLSRLAATSNTSSFIRKITTSFWRGRVKAGKSTTSPTWLA